MARRSFRLGSLLASRSLRALALLACLLIVLTPSYSFGMSGMSGRAHADAPMSGSMAGMPSATAMAQGDAGVSSHHQMVASCCGNRHSATCHCDALCVVAMVPGLQVLDVTSFLASLDAPFLDTRAPSTLNAPPLRPPAV